MNTKDKIDVIYDAIFGAMRFKEGGLTGCRHGTDPNYDQLIVANSSLFNEQWVGRIHRGQSETDRAIEAIRFHTEQIETSQKAIDEAKALLLSKGVEYVGVKAEPAEDMSDPKNWRKGDLLEVIGEKGDSEFNTGEIVSFSGEIHEDGDFKCWYTDLSEWWWVKPRNLKFHSRPTQSK